MFQVTSCRYGVPAEPPPLPSKWSACDSGWTREHVEFGAETVTVYWKLELPNG